MKRKVLALFTLLSGLASSLYAQNNFEPGALFVKVKAKSVELEKHAVLANDALASHLKSIEKPFTMLKGELESVYRLRFDDQQSADMAMSAFKNDTEIEYVEQIPLYRLNYTPNDLQSNQWYLTKIEAPRAWDFVKGSKNIVVAVIDNGVRLDHQDLQGQIWTNPLEIAGNNIDDDANGYIDDIHGVDIADEDSDPASKAGIPENSPFIHGTHVAGLVSATSDNSTGIASMGYNCSIMAVKCALDNGDGLSLINTEDGMAYAIASKADIISMSFSSSLLSLTGLLLVQQATSAGIVMVAAAGNEASILPSYPASYPQVVSVAASDRLDALASFTNYGLFIDVVAPGVDVLSTTAGSPNSYGNLSGTSMATPITSGLLALLKSFRSDLSADQLINAVKAGCDNINSQNQLRVGLMGSGRINAYKTIQPYLTTTSVKDLEYFPLLVYPNPAHDKLNISLKSSFGTAEFTISLYDVRSQLVHKEIIHSNGQINLSGLAKGLYFLQYSLNDKTYVQKVVVE